MHATKPSLAHLEFIQREVRRAERHLAWAHWKFTARNAVFRVWHNFWRPLVFFWLKVGGAVFFGGLGLVFAGKMLKTFF